MRKSIVAIILLCFVVLVCGCFWEKNGSLPDKISGINETGSIGMKMQFADLGKLLSKAPSNIVNVKISTTTNAFSQTFSAVLGQGVIEDVSVGSHTITAAGLDSSGVMLFYGEASVTVTAGQVTPVNVFLSSSGTMNIENNATTTGTITVILYMTSPSAVDMMISNDPSFTSVVWETFAATKNWSLMTGVSGPRTVYVKYKDSSGNVSNVISDSIDYTTIPSNAILVDKYAPGIIQDGNSWATAYKTLQQALNGASGGDSIWISSGEYTPEVDATGAVPGDDRDRTFLIDSGISIVGGFSGYNGSQETTVASRDWETNIVTLSGDLGVMGTDTDNSYHVVTSRDCTLDGIQIRFGYADGTAPYNDGGGIMCDSGFAPSIANSIVSSNYASHHGGGMICEGVCSITGSTFEFNSCKFNGGAIHNTNATLTISDSGFAFNDAQFGHGGVMFNSNTTGTIANCYFISNTAGSSGGAISNMSTSNPAITDTVFDGNNANSGGAVSNDNSTPTFSNCDFTGNTADSGGGLYISNSSQVELANSDFIDNDAATNGGAMRLALNGDVKISGGIFSLNDANPGSGSGGAIYSNSAGSVIEIRDASFQSNTALYGGAIEVTDGSFVCLVSQFRGNSAESGGAVLCSELDPVFNNCVFEVNTATSGDGGALYIEELSAGALNPIVANCVFDRNTATTNGGAIAFMNHHNIIVNGCTFYGNDASVNGGGIYLNIDIDSFALVNSIMWNNNAVTGKEVYSLSTPSIYFNSSDVKGGVLGTGVATEGDGAAINVSGSSIDFDPVFAAAESFGGLTPTCTGGPVDGANGTNALVDVYDVDNNMNFSELLPIDAAGAPRYVDDPGSTNSGLGPPYYLDMGAYEIQ